MSKASDFFAVSGGGSPWGYPALPSTINVSRFTSTLNRLQTAGTLINGVSLEPALISGYLDGVVVWTVSNTDVDANVNEFLSDGACSWLDTVNGRIWVFGIDVSTAPDTLYTAYIDIETGTVTNIGSTQFSLEVGTVADTAVVVVERASIDTGNFTLYTATHTIVIDEANGSEVSNTPTANSSGDIGSYKVSGGKFLGVYTSDPDGSEALAASIDGLIETLYVPRFLMASGTVNTTYFVRWGNTVQTHGSSGASFKILRCWDATEFDTWANSMLGYLGVQ